MSDRKYIRIALNGDDAKAFAARKDQAEQATAVSMSDSLFALSLIRHALKYSPP